MWSNLHLHTDSTSTCCRFTPGRRLRRVAGIQDEMTPHKSYRRDRQGIVIVVFCCDVKKPQLRQGICSTRENVCWGCWSCLDSTQSVRCLLTCNRVKNLIIIKQLLNWYETRTWSTVFNSTLVGKELVENGKQLLTREVEAISLVFMVRLIKSQATNLMAKWAGLWKCFVWCNICLPKDALIKKTQNKTPMSGTQDVNVKGENFCRELEHF